MMGRKSNDDFVDRMIFQSNYISAALDIIHSIKQDKLNQDTLNLFYKGIVIQTENLFNEITDYLKENSCS